MMRRSGHTASTEVHVPTMKRDRDCAFAQGLSSLSFVDRVRELGEGLITLDPHPSVASTLPPNWSMDPIGDTNWKFQFHALRWVQALKRAHDTDGNPHHLQTYLAILEDWYQRNPWSSPPSDQSWADHSTAMRARVYAACAQAMTSPWPAWLHLALDEHVDVLSGPDLYPSGGNHALNQNVGLFAAASMLKREDEQRFAISRTAELLERSVDEQGVTDEQSTEYQVYNFRRYREAATLFRDAGAVLPDVFGRIERMPELIAHATLPNGRDAMIGDACDDLGFSVPETIAEFAASLGTRGPRPQERFRVFDRGYVLARTGWGDRRPFEHETHLSVRFGPPRVPHGHPDAGAIALYAAGSRIISNAGKYAYAWNEKRRYVLSRRAQNSVTFVDRPYGPDGGSELLSIHEREEVLVAVVRDNHHPDVDHLRTIAFHLDAGAVVVADRFRTLDGQPTMAEQRFRLDPAFDHLVTSPTQIRASHPDGLTVDVVQHAHVDGLRAVRGGRQPLEGWVSYTYGEVLEAPVVVSTVERSAGLILTTIQVSSEHLGPALEFHYDAAAGEFAIGGRDVSIA